VTIVGAANPAPDKRRAGALVVRQVVEDDHVARTSAQVGQILALLLKRLQVFFCLTDTGLGAPLVQRHLGNCPSLTPISASETWNHRTSVMGILNLVRGNML